MKASRSDVTILHAKRMDGAVEESQEERFKTMDGAVEERPCSENHLNIRK